MYSSYISAIAILGPLLLQGISTVGAASILRTKSPQAQGCVDPEFAKIRERFQSYLDSGEELGVSLSININGKDVVNLWGGYADINKTKPWNEDTLVNVWSTGKTLVSLAALTLIEKGQLDIHEKVATYWPEFAANGKQNIEVRHLLSHTAGLAAWSTNMTLEDIYNTTYAAAQLGAQAPLWSNRSVSGYGAVTYGYPIGELIQRITNKTMTQYIADEITGPLNADFSIGVPEKNWIRVGELVPPPPIKPPTDDLNSIAFRAFANPPLPAQLASTPGWRNAEIGASNGHGSAKGITKALSVITLGGERNNVKLLSPKTIDLIFKEQASGMDLVLGFPVTFGVGYGLYKNGTEALTAGAIPRSQSRVAYWGGTGGSMVFMDLEKRITFAYVMNRMRGDLTGTKAFQDYTTLLYDALGSQ